MEAGEDVAEAAKREVVVAIISIIAISTVIAIIASIAINTVIIIIIAIIVLVKVLLSSSFSKK